MLGPGAYFATCIDHTEFKAVQFNAYICALVDPGKEFFLTADRHDHKARAGDGTTVYFQHPQNKDEFCCRTSEQIKEWIIVIDQDAIDRAPKVPGSDEVIVDKFHPDVYVGCIFQR